jgi:hypothetical protein
MADTTYYDAKFCLLETDSVPEENGEKYESRGFFSGELPTDVEVHDAGVNEQPLIEAFVSDNGRSGEGFWLSFSVRERPQHQEVFAVRLTPRQAEILRTALDAVIQLRKIEAPT